jgi:hypothetical protein
MKTKRLSKPRTITLTDSTIFEGDALLVLGRLRSASVQFIVTGANR